MPSRPTTRDVPTDIVTDVDTAAVGRRLVAMWSGGSLDIELPPRGAFSIGRGTDVDVVIDHPSVSRLHARLVLDGHLRLEDLGSSNGTKVDGERLAPNAVAPLGPGSVAELGTVLVCVRPVTQPASAAAALPPLVVSAPAMQRVVHLVDLVASSPLNVVLIGESGVGKTTLAERLHAGSPRAKSALVRLNCAAAGAEMALASVLFGFEASAFAGAAEAKAGLVEAAHGGTLLLDEIGELPLVTQARLLRLLESKEAMRAGAVSPRTVDVRVVAATTRDLNELVAAGSFRADLLFRLDGFSIRVPPLRERATEIAALARAFLEAAKRSSGRMLRFSDLAIDRLVRHAWPGNVSELHNVVARSAVVCQTDTIEPLDLHLGTTSGASESNPSASSIAPEERKRILDALERTVWNQTRAAELLGMSRRTLLKRLDALGVPRPRKQEEER